MDEKTDPNIRVGTRLRNARSAKNLSIEDVARQLKFRREYIEAIEAMQVTRLPRGFVNPYIRDYAKFLELDPARCVEDFNIQCGALSQAGNEAPEVRTRPASTVNWLKLIMISAIVLLTGAGIWLVASQLTGQSKTEQDVTATPTMAITPHVNGARKPVTDTVSPSLAGVLKLSIRANERAWIEIRGADGTLFIDRQFARGESYDLRVGAGWTLTTQDAGAFEWLVDGRPANAVGEADQALYTLSIDDVAAGFVSDKN